MNINTLNNLPPNLPVMESKEHKLSSAGKFSDEFIESRLLANNNLVPTCTLITKFEDWTKKWAPEGPY
jgi:hypothetical protein